MSVPSSISTDPLARLKQVLLKAGLTTDAIGYAAPFPALAGSDPLARAMERTAEPTALHTILRLFVVGGTVPVAVAEEALAPLRVGELVRAGLLEAQDEAVRSVFALDPFGDLLAVHDFRARKIDVDGTVLGIGAATRLLAGVTVRRGGERVLDVGTGQGFQALLAARHAASVIGTDINPRALRAAGLSAAINGLGIELREGSLFEPVAGMEFDLIISNPPFVVTPKHDVVALSGGSDGDALFEKVLRDGPRHLAQGGFACFLGSWAHQDDRDWPERPREWLRGSGCDVLLIRSRAQDPRQYAVQWIDESEGIAGIGSVPGLPVWLEHFARRGYRRFSMGAVILRKRSGANWVAAESCLEQRPAQAGEQIRRIFDGRTFLAGLPRAEALMDAPLTVAEACEVVKQRRGAGGSEAIKVRQADGFEFALGIDAGLAEMLAACDGSRTPRAIVMDAVKAKGGDAARALAQLRAFLTRMVEVGAVGTRAG